MEQLVEVWRGAFLESIHYGDAVVCGPDGSVLAGWGNPDKIILPRSSCKILQALPLVESGAAKAAGLTDKQLALACASHNGATLHVDAVTDWLAALGLSETDLRCGAQPTSDKDLRKEMVKSGTEPDQRHNNCSGKHSGFLTLGQHLGAGAEYIEADHPVQLAAREAFEEMTGEVADGYVIDGCSAPNFSTSLRGLATSMARIAVPDSLKGVRKDAAIRLRGAMATYPEMVAGEGRACTELMRAMANGTVIKTGAEGVFTAILPGRGLGVALKITDGTTRASEAAMTALLVRLGVADAEDPMVQKRMRLQMTNWRGTHVGNIQPSDVLFADGARL